MTKKHWIMAALAAAVITGGYFFMGDSTPKTTYLTETVQRGDIEKKCGSDRLN